MARKTMIQKVAPAKAGSYADYPACLPSYKWLVELAMKNPEVMFNVPTVAGPSYCKCCGAAYWRKDHPAHVEEHAQQLRLGKSGKPNTVMPVRTYDIVDGELDVDSMKQTPVVFDEEMMLTILTSIQEREEELTIQWSEAPLDLAAVIADEIEKETIEGRAPEPHFCADCA